MTTTTSRPASPPVDAGPPAATRPDRGTPVLAWLGPIAPAAVLLLLFFAGPVVWSVVLAFTDASLTGATAQDTSFVGLDNFARLFSDPAVLNSIVLTVVFVLGSAVVGQNLLGLLIALGLRGRGPVLRGAVGFTLLAAYVVPEIVAAFVWYAFLGQEGTLNTWLAALGLPAQDWLFSAPVLAIILANVWRGTAFTMLVYTAALQSVPTDVEENAEVDGAGALQRLWYITLPLIRRTIGTNLVLITLQTLQVFTLVFVLTSGGPGTRSQTLPLLTYEQAFQFSDLGYGTAISLVLLGVGALFSLVYIRLLRKDAA